MLGGSVVKNMMLNFILALVVSGSTAATVMAAPAAEAQGGSLLLTLFIGFFALIVVFQLVPAVLLFVGIVKGLFSREHRVEQKSSNR
jgi:hypothetical protein